MNAKQNAQTVAVVGGVFLALASAACGKDQPTTTGSSGSGTPAAHGSGAASGPQALRAVQVAVDRKTSYALMSDGTIRAWGNNDNGALGDGRKGTDAATPVEVKGISGAVQVSAGSNGGGTNVQLACAVLGDGAVKCWGSGSYPMPREDQKEQLAPANIPELAGAKEVVLGPNGFGCALMGDKTVRCWGSGAFGVLGQGDDKEHYAPVAVPGLADVEQVSVASNHACARLGNGEVKCWGFNSSHTVLPGDGEDKVKSPKDTGVKGAKLVHAGHDASYAVTAEGLVAWGSSFSHDEKGSVEGTYKMANVTDVIAMASGDGGTCALEKAGTVKCWGSNDYGQLGTGEVGPAQYKPVAVKGLGDAVSLDLGAKHACAATKGGKVFCWGYNQRGEIGDGTLQDRPAPVEVKALLDEKLPPAADGADDVKESAETVDFGKLPAGCKHDASLAVEVPSLGLKSLDAKSAYAIRNEKTVYLKLANYNQNPKDLFWDEPRGKQARLSVDFYHVDIGNKEAKPIDLGSYDLDTANERYISPSIRNAKKSTMLANITLEGLKAGSVTLTYLGDDWVCGELALKTKEESVKGSFAAKVVKQ